MKNWILAARLKTLPLSAGGILLGSALAKLNHIFKPEVLILGLTTAMLLQILSNYANDYGDFAKGTDTAANRTDRMLQSGAIKPGNMLAAIVILALCTLISGLGLLYVSGMQINLTMGIFLMLGLIAIASAIKYTVGKNALAYRGLGDVFVLVFFGFVSVCGIFFLQTGLLMPEVFFAGFGCGLLSVGVLNVNNIRDIESDKKSGKITLPVRKGAAWAISYHRLLIWMGATSIILSFFYHIQLEINAVSPLEFLMIFAVFSPALFILASHIGRLQELVVQSSSDSTDKPGRRNLFNRELRTLSLNTLLIVIIYWILVLLYQ